MWPFRRTPRRFGSLLLAAWLVAVNLGPFVRTEIPYRETGIAILGLAAAALLVVEWWWAD
jgi:hypothetical protein